MGRASVKHALPGRFVARGGSDLSKGSNQRRNTIRGDVEALLSAVRKKKEVALRGLFMVVLVPFIGACPSVGFSWADGALARGMPSFIVTLFSSALLAFGFGATLRVRHGAKEMGELFSRRYAKLSVSGTSAGLAAAFTCASLKRLSATDVEVLLLLGIAFYLPLEYLVLGNLPSSVKTIVVLLVITLSLLHAVTSSSPDYGGIGISDPVGMGLAIASAFLDSLSDLWIEYVSNFSRFRLPSPNETDKMSPFQLRRGMSSSASTDDERHAETLRVMAANSFFAMPICVVGAVVLEMDYFRHHDWLPYAGLGGVLPLILYDGYSNICIAWYGATRVALPDSLTVLVVLVLESLFLGRLAMKPAPILVLVSLSFVVILSALTERAVDTATEVALTTCSKSAHTRSEFRSSVASDEGDLQIVSVPTVTFCTAPSFSMITRPPRQTEDMPKSALRAGPGASTGASPDLVTISDPALLPETGSSPDAPEERSPPFARKEIVKPALLGAPTASDAASDGSCDAASDAGSVRSKDPSHLQSRAVARRGASLGGLARHAASLEGLARDGACAGGLAALSALHDLPPKSSLCTVVGISHDSLDWMPLGNSEVVLQMQDVYEPDRR